MTTTATRTEGNPDLLAILDAPLPEVRRASLRREPRTTWAREIRGLFRAMGLRGVRVVTPSYSMARSVEITIPGTLDHEMSDASGHDRPTCRLCQQACRGEDRIREIVVAAFPDLDDRSDSRSDYHDNPLSIHHAERV